MLVIVLREFNTDSGNSLFRANFWPRVEIVVK